jgi:hypothetical protein
MRTLAMSAGLLYALLMALLLIGKTIRIETTDDALDRIRDLLQNPPFPGQGFWLAGQLEIETDGEPSHPDPRDGHQRLWIPSGTLLSLIYDRPLHPNPDRITEEHGVILL